MLKIFLYCPTRRADLSLLPLPSLRFTAARKVNSTLLAVACAIIFGPLFCSEAVAGTVLTTESFRDPSLTDPLSWVSTHKVGAAPPCLTAADIDDPNQILASGDIGGCNSAGTAPVDLPGQGALRLTNLSTYQNGAMLFNTPLPTIGGLDVTFNQSQWGGSHADGISFFVKNGANTSIAPGAQGGALGYASIPGASLGGVPGGLFGIGLDAYGGFSTSAVGYTQGCPNPPGSRPNSIAVRGPDTSAAGDGSAGYCYIGGSTVSSPGLYGSTRSAGMRKVRVVVDPATVAGTRQITVYLNDVQRLQVPVPQAFINAQTFKFGFAAASGDVTDNHEIWTADIATVNPLPEVSVQADSTSSAQHAPLAAISFQASGFSGADNFSTPPVCKAYTDTTYVTPITTSTPPGTYVTHCSGGVAAGYAIRYVDGTYIVNSPTTYSISATVSSGNGSVNCSPSSVLPGGSSSCTATPDSGFQVQSWGGACLGWGISTRCTLKNIQSNLASTVSFVPTDYTVTVTVDGGNGIATCNPRGVAAGDSSTCKAIPIKGYRVQGWTGACAAAGTETQCALTNINSNQTSTVSFELIPSYAVTASVAGGNGSVSCAPGTVTAGGQSQCTAVPNAGFQVQNWTGACASAGSNSQCTLTNIQSNQATTVSFALIPAATYTVTATAADNYGTASCLPNSVKAGDSSTCYAVPLAGFRVKSWSGACAAAGSNAQCSLTNINSNQASTVSFELIPATIYSVSATVVGGNYGSVSCAPDTVQAGQDSACYAVPYAGYRVQSWGGACAAVGSNAQCALTKVQADQVATVSFELIPPATYTISATVLGGTGGSVSCLPTSVTAGQNTVCYAVPTVGYQIQSWGGDCAAASNNAQCSLTNIQTDQVSTVSFEAVPLPTYAVSTRVASGDGTVDCAPSSVTKGDSSSCTAHPDPGWQVVGWGGACAATGANASCYLPKIQKDEVSTVSFGLIPPNTYHVSATVVLGNGAVSCTPDTVTSGGSSTCTAMPDAGFQVQNWGGACALSGSNAQCYLTKIKQDQQATVSFAPLPPAQYTVSATVVGGNGAVSCTPGTVTAGGNSACTAVPDAGFKVQGWTNACAAAGTATQCDLTNIQANQSATVSFSALPVPSYTVSATVAGGNGTVSCGPSSVPQGGSSSCTAVPALGYQVDSWTGDCATTGSNAQCALTNIQTNKDSTVSFSALPTNTYHVSASVVLGNGSVNCTPTSVPKGGQSVCTALPATGWQVQSWGDACAGAGANAQCVLSKISKDAAATVSFALILPATHSVSATVTGGNGTVSCNPTTVTKNDASTCLAVPDPGYQVDSWTGACAGAGSNPQCYLTKIQKDAVSTVSFVELPANHFSVVATVLGGNGTVSCTPASVTAGQGSTCTAVPEAGYQVQSWAGACLLMGSATQCNLTNIQTDQTSTVSFAAVPPISYTVSATVASGSGTVSCAPSPVIKGGSSNCTAVPASGWQVTGWTGACAATGANVQCYLPKVQKNENSTVTFAPLPQNTYSVTANVIVGLGSVTCSPGSVFSGGGSTCTAIPATGYQISGWDGACSSSASNAQCFLTQINSNQASTVSFAQLPFATYTVSATVGSGRGSVSCIPTSVSAGGSMTCTAVPDPGYKVRNWTGACASAGTSTTCVINNVTFNPVTSVNFVSATPPPNPIPVLPIWGAALMGLGLLGAARRRL